MDLSKFIGGASPCYKVASVISNYTDFPRELGKKMREEMDRVRQLQEEGFKLKLQFIQEGKQAKEEKQVSLYYKLHEEITTKMLVQLPAGVVTFFVTEKMNASSGHFNL